MALVVRLFKFTARVLEEKPAKAGLPGVLYLASCAELADPASLSWINYPRHVGPASASWVDYLLPRSADSMHGCITGRASARSQAPQARFFTDTARRCREGKCFSRPIRSYPGHRRLSAPACAVEAVLLQVLSEAASLCTVEAHQQGALPPRASHSAINLNRRDSPPRRPRCNGSARFQRWRAGPFLSVPFLIYLPVRG